MEPGVAADPAADHDDDLQPVLLDGRADDRLRGLRQVLSVRRRTAHGHRLDSGGGGLGCTRALASAARTLVGPRAHPVGAAGGDSGGLRVLGFPVDPAVRFAATAGHGLRLTT